MADNTVQTGADTIATDDLLTLNGGAVSAVKAQRTKVGFGADSIFRDVELAYPLPVGGGLISAANSSTANLAAGAVFTGTSEEVTQYTSVTVSIYTSHVNATDGLQMQQSMDGTNWDIIDAYNIPATTGKTFAVHCVARYFRLVYTNGATATTSLRIQTIYHLVSPMQSSVRPQDGRGNDNDMGEELAYMMGYNGTSWDRVRTLAGAVAISGSQAATTSASWTSATAANTAITANVTGYNTVSVSAVQGTNITGGAISFEVSNNNTDWLPIALNRVDAYVSGTTYTLTASTNVGFTGSVDAFTYFRVRLNTAIAGTGTVALSFIPQAFPIEPTVTVGQANGASLNMQVSNQITLATGTNTYGAVYGAVRTTGGATPYTLISAASTNATSVKASAGTVYGIQATNNTTTIAFLKLYNTNAAPTVGTTVAVKTILLPANSTTVVPIGPAGLAFGTGIALAITGAGTTADTTAVAAAQVIANLDYV